jgi:hypothetical protein
MTVSQILLLAGVILLAHELTPTARAILGLSVGTWGAVAAAAGLIF